MQNSHKKTEKKSKKKFAFFNNGLKYMKDKHLYHVQHKSCNNRIQQQDIKRL